MSTIFLALSLLFLAQAVPVQAAGLIEKVQETYRKTNSFRANFVQTTFVEVLDREVRSQGEIIFEKPSRFLIHYSDGQERKFISDGKTLWVVYPEEKEVEVYENLEGVMANEALIFLGGLGTMTQEFLVKETSGTQLELTPKDQKALFKKVLLTIDPTTSLVRATTLFPRNGNKSRYLFSDVQTNKSVSKKNFQWKESDYKVLHPLK